MVTFGHFWPKSTKAPETRTRSRRGPFLGVLGGPKNDRSRGFGIPEPPENLSGGPKWHDPSQTPASGPL